MFSISFRKHHEEKELNPSCIYFDHQNVNSHTRFIITSTACASSVLVSSYRSATFSMHLISYRMFFLKLKTMLFLKLISN